MAGRRQPSSRNWRARCRTSSAPGCPHGSCIVNGPGESKHANIGISLPGTGEAPSAPVYEDGVKTVTLKGDRIASEFKDIIERYVQRTYVKKLQS